MHASISTSKYVMLLYLIKDVGFKMLSNIIYTIIILYSYSWSGYMVYLSATTDGCIQGSPYKCDGNVHVLEDAALNTWCM